MSVPSRIGAGALASTVLLATVLAGCGADGPGGSSGRCVDAPEALVSDVRDRARQDFMTGDRRVSGLKVKRVVTTELAPDLRRFGADRLVVVLYDAFFAGEEDGSMPGVVSTSLFAADADGVVGPVSRLANSFAYDKPDGAEGYDAWATQVDESESGSAARACVSPY